MVYVTALLTAVILHELGHYVAYRGFGFKPSIRFTKFGSIYMGENVINKIKSSHLGFTAYMGIIAGLPVVLFSTELTLIYLLISLFDINIIINVLSMDKEDLNDLFINVQKKEIDKLFYEDDKNDYKSV